VLATVIPAVAIAWAIRPRRDNFDPIEPRLAKDAQPQLFTEVEDVGRKLEQKPPAEVYIDGRVNASVSQRGGLMGIGSRRVMFIGLPLLQGMTTAEFRSVLAHEFGHYHSGDTTLGPWLYKTRAAIGRALESLSERDYVKRPFQLYAILFLRTTLAVSRRQEYAADMLAARHYGGSTHISALRKFIGLSAAYNSYWDMHVAPALQASCRPPLMDGFRHFLAQESVIEGIDRFAEQVIKVETQGRYDSHPPIRERINALAGLDGNVAAGDSVPAISLVKDVQALEAEVLASRFGQSARRYRVVEWEEVGTVVYLPRYEREAARFAPALETVRMTDVPGVLKDPAAFIERVHASTKERIATQAAPKRVPDALTAGIIVALVEHGWRLMAMPGEPLALVKDRQRLLPEVAVGSLKTESPDIARWNSVIGEAGVKELRLAGAPVAARAN
jgi:Zn-dependent protease with chaperone function